MTKAYDAVVVGTGPNGLAAAITLARAGLSVLAIEARATIGGGTRTAALTEPGFLHDVCSAVHPMAVASPFFRELELAGHGVTWVHPEAPLAHPLPDGTAAVLERSVAATAATLGADGRAYEQLMRPLVAQADTLLADVVGPPRLPRHPLLALRFGRKALQPAARLASRTFKADAARGLIAGLAAHSALALEQPASSAIALVLGLAGHAYGWPVARGGSQSIADALGRQLVALGGEIVTGRPLASVRELPPARLVLLDLTPRQILALDGLDLPPAYARRLARYRYGPGVFKLDWALSAPIPWRAGACRRAATVHVGGTLAEIAASERAAWEGRVPERPFVLLTQPSLFDPTRAPPGRHTAWGYCHVGAGSDRDLTGAIEAQVERFAPGFRDCILARHAMGPADFERYNANDVGGDILGGATDLMQSLARPVAAWNPYSLRRPGFYICSASTPPGAGVHGLSGYFAAKSALAWLKGGGVRQAMS